MVAIAVLDDKKGLQWREWKAISFGRSVAGVNLGVTAISCHA